MATARVWGARRLLAGLLAATALAACATEINDELPGSRGGDPADGGSAGSAGMDGGPFGNADRDALTSLPDAGYSRDAELTADAFFVNDPAPQHCGPDGVPESVAAPSGTPECPDDKNREGCPCHEAGASAPCWPGKRVNRNHGICRDGVSTCLDTIEFGLRWGACQGYVLPDETALAGPSACGCFSSGTWAIDNLKPCIFRSASGNTYLYSSLPGGVANDCGGNITDPPQVPPASWSPSTLNIDCAGQFQLCYTIKAGVVSNPQPSDCIVMQSCLDVWYEQVGVAQPLPELPAWVSTDTACAGRFVDVGGYGEMSVRGHSVECDVVDDGAGSPYVFFRTNYCPTTCGQTPDSPECRACRAGGSGMFGN